MVDEEECAVASEPFEEYDVNSSIEVQQFVEDDGTAGAAEYSGEEEYLEEYLEQSTETVSEIHQSVENDGVENANEEDLEGAHRDLSGVEECLELESQDSFKMEQLESSLHEYYSEDSDVVEVMAYLVHENEYENESA